MKNILAFVGSLLLFTVALSLCGQSRIVPVDGAAGATGPAGPAGPPGDAGAPGPTGPAGNATQATTGSPFGTTDCTCAVVYDSHGVPITEVRDSGVRCPLRDGTLALCTNGQIAVLAGGDGGGDLGVLVEQGRTNAAYRSEEFNDVLWPRYGTIALGATNAACLEGACTTTAGALTLPRGAATFYFGTSPSATGNEANGVIKSTCVSGSPSTCI